MVYFFLSRGSPNKVEGDRGLLGFAYTRNEKEILTKQNGTKTKKKKKQTNPARAIFPQTASVFWASEVLGVEIPFDPFLRRLGRGAFLLGISTGLCNVFLGQMDTVTGHDVDDSRVHLSWIPGPDLIWLHCNPLTLTLTPTLNH